MARAIKSQDDNRIQGFTSLGDNEAAAAEGAIRISEIDGYRLRRIWQDGEWWHSVSDLVGALAESDDGRKYWNKLKQRLAEEGSEVVTNCHQLKLPAADGKLRATDCATTESVLRIVESVPSKRAEPIKRYLAMAGAERIKDTAKPSRLIDRAIETYRNQGRDDEWIEQRLQSIESRKELTDEWTKRGVSDRQMGAITNEMGAITMGVQPDSHANLKGVKRDQLREHMTKTELALTNLSEVAGKDIMQTRDTKDFDSSREASLDGAHVARGAREKLEEKLGRQVVSKENFLPKPDGSDTPLFKAAARPQSKKR